MTLVCQECGKSKPASGFYQQPRRLRPMPICKDCHKGRVSARRIKRRAELSEKVRIEMTEKEEIDTVVTPTGRRLATIKEACRYGRFSHTKCYELINAKRIRAYKFDTRTLVDLDSIDAMFASLPEM
ncbi:helix-turn-helix domain-containing protein [Bradyrhizobium sp. Leo170]|uniref:helix-turn-helix domain-containing protein n=2 Tax=Nitrobacteraceae TaxID=41294 RepID=UPI001FE0C4CC|nr:helix-turn-helix domain-containing protein [Bradyrhizobium sp. Leo170]